MIRRATLEDARSLARLYADFFAEDAISVPPDAILTNVQAMLADDRAALWMAEEAGEIAGLASATMTLGVEFGWAAEVEDLYVHPGHRGKGLARTLFRSAVDWAEERGATEIILVITPEAEAEQGLVAFYEKLGLRKSGRTVMYKTGNR